jgi:hypothetical protein
MVNLETYEGNDGQTKVRDDFPDREWVNIGDNQRLSNIVLESARLKENSRFGEVIMVFCHDADTGELLAFNLGAQLVTQGKRKGKRGTTWSGTGIETLLNVDDDGMSNPEIKPVFKDKKIWVGKTLVAGKSWKAFECDLIDGEPKFDSSYNGLEDDIDEEVDEGDDEIDYSDLVNIFIKEELQTGVNELQVAKEVQDKFTHITSPVAIDRVMKIKKTL